MNFKRKKKIKKKIDIKYEKFIFLFFSFFFIFFLINVEKIYVSFTIFNYIIYYYPLNFEYITVY